MKKIQKILWKKFKEKFLKIVGGAQKKSRENNWNIFQWELLDKYNEKLCCKSREDSDSNLGQPLREVLKGIYELIPVQLQRSSVEKLRHKSRQNIWEISSDEPFQKFLEELWNSGKTFGKIPGMSSYRNPGRNSIWYPANAFAKNPGEALWKFFRETSGQFPRYGICYWQNPG